MSAVGTLLRVVDQPSRAMGEVTERPRLWLLAAALIVVVSMAMLWFTAPLQIVRANEAQAQVIERMTANMPADQARLVRESAKDMTLSRYLLTTGLVGAAMAALGWVVRGAVVHFSSMALGGHSQWPATYAVCLWAMLPYAVRDLLLTVYTLVTQKVPEHAGLGFLVASGDLLQDSRSLQYALLSNLDPFVLWHLLLLAVGIAVATKMGRAKAAILAIVVFTVFMAFKIVPVALSAAVMGNLGG